MTVLRPSLPPFNSITTRTVSLAPARWPGGAKAAVRLTNSGALSPRATRPVGCRKSRRVWVITAPFRGWPASGGREPPEGGAVSEPSSGGSRPPLAGLTPLLAGVARSSELELGLRQHQVAEAADAAVGGVLFG